MFPLAAPATHSNVDAFLTLPSRMHFLLALLRSVSSNASFACMIECALYIYFSRCSRPPIKAALGLQFAGRNAERQCETVYHTDRRYYRCRPSLLLSSRKERIFFQPLSSHQAMCTFALVWCSGWLGWKLNIGHISHEGLSIRMWLALTRSTKDWSLSKSRHSRHYFAGLPRWELSHQSKERY